MLNDDPLALYIHWPFCVSKCPYCDFNSHVRDTVDQAEWRAALLSDLAHEASLLPGRTLGSIFFGGGTPSLMEPGTVAALIDVAFSHWPAADHPEITLEANPSSVEASRFADLAQAGVNRVSLGLQSLDADALLMLGRAHGVAEGLQALETAQRHFERVNFDLIYARPGQTAEHWSQELDQALALGATHMSLYQLTIEPGTRFETAVRTGELVPLDPDLAADQFELTQERMADAGRPAYEVSNHAVPGDESRHNRTYWRYQDYAGVGPGAHGRRGGMATVRHRKPENWLSAVARKGDGLESETLLTPAERAREALVMGLRLYEGVDLARISAMTGVEALVDEKAKAQLCSQGFLEANGTRLAVAPKGMLLLDAILGNLVVA